MVARRFLVVVLGVLAIAGVARANHDAMRLALSVELSEMALQPDAAILDVGVGDLVAFYEARDFAPLWSGDDHDFRRAAPLVAHLEDAAQEGLEPSDYAIVAAVWERRGEIAGEADAARLELVLSAALVRYVTDLAYGRIDPDTVDASLFDLPERPAPSTLLWDAAAVADGDLGAWLDGLAPAWPQYRLLRRALADMRARAAAGGWPELPDGESLKPGADDPRVPVLRRQLAAMGEFDGDDLDSTLFDPALEAAVVRFQQRFGLDDDGIVGRRTRAALNVPAEARVAQIALNMERLRWLDEDIGDRFIWVNIPAFALAVIENGRAVLTMDVIVGRDYRRTPVFAGLMTYLEINPYWNVPFKLAVEDLLPKQLADPTYLASHGFEVFAGWESTVPLDPATLPWDTLSKKNFPYRLRQLPGEENALGRIKFMLPNEYAVYLHDTPHRELFSRAERAFSSGCVRVSKPTELAHWLLRDDPEWPAELDAIWATHEMTRVSLPDPITVYVSYMTAWVGEDGRVRLRDDIYGRDADLAAALAAR